MPEPPTPSCTLQSSFLSSFLELLIGLHVVCLGGCDFTLWYMTKKITYLLTNYLVGTSLSKIGLAQFVSSLFSRCLT